MANPVDMLDRELVVGDYVVSHNHIYSVTEIGRLFGGSTAGYIKLMLIDPSKTTRPVKKLSSDTCKLDQGEVLFWKLKKDY